MVSASQTIFPGSEGRIEGRLREAGLVFDQLKDVPEMISKNIANCLKEAFGPPWGGLLELHLLGCLPGMAADTEPGGDQAKDAAERLRASRQVMKVDGNMSSATLLFVMEEMRRRSVEDGAATTGEGLEWGVLLGFGPGVIVETMVLRSSPLSQTATVLLAFSCFLFHVALWLIMPYYHFTGK